MDTHPTWTALLERAVTEPGVVSSAYSQFHQYSLGNQLFAWGQCLARGLRPGPMATFPRWKELGRHVRRGERAIAKSITAPLRVAREAEASLRPIRGNRRRSGPNQTCQQLCKLSARFLDRDIGIACAALAATIKNTRVGCAECHSPANPIALVLTVATAAVLCATKPASP